MSDKDYWERYARNHDASSLSVDFRAIAASLWSRFEVRWKTMVYTLPVQKYFPD